MYRPTACLLPLAGAVLLLGSVATASAQSLEICVVHNNADHPSITAIVNGMNEEAPRYDAAVTYFDPAFDPQRQVSMIEDCVARNADIVVVNAVDPAAVVPALRAVNQAGIPVIMQNANTNEEGEAYIETYVGSQSFDQGYAVGRMVAEAMPDGGKLAIITGRPGQIDVVQRTAGLRAALNDAKSTVEIIAEEPADWSKDRALTVMQALLTRYPDLDAVFGQDDPMALGALQAIQASGVDDILVFGVNGNKDACAAIAAKQMFGTAMQLSYLVGVYTVRAAYDVSQGRLVPNQILAPTAPVTQDNIAEWQDQCW
jgi:ribose transport system substrate-binding protein